MKKFIYVLFTGLLLLAATGTEFAQEKIALAKTVKSDKKESETNKDSADKEVSNSTTTQSSNDSSCESCRWFEPTAATFSMRYRTITNSANVRTFNQGQQRIVLGGKFKFDKEGRYTINAQASSGYYFNWAYADTGLGNTGNDALHKSAPAMGYWIAEYQLPGVVQTAVQNYIRVNYPTATPAQIAQLTPVLTAQFTPVIRPQVFSGVVKSLENTDRPGKGWNIYVRQLYFQAKPINGVELSYGSLPINKGVNSESTSYDDDGYVSGGRISIKRPKQLWFDEMSATYAYLGDVYTPNFFRRAERFKQSNYHQFLLRKKLFNGRVDASVDYTFQDGTDTMREGALIKVKETKFLDTIRVEAYQRIGTNQVNNKIFKGGNGFYIQGEKTIADKLTLSAGVASIDRNYSVYGEYSYSGLDFYGFALNGDQTGVGKRVITKANYKLTDDLSISMLYSQTFNNDPNEMRFYWNKTHFNVAVTYDILKGVKKHFGWFK